jgi:hypothetical protein
LISQGVILGSHGRTKDNGGAYTDRNRIRKRDDEDNASTCLRGIRQKNLSTAFSIKPSLPDIQITRNSNLGIEPSNLL